MRVITTQFTHFQHPGAYPYENRTAQLILPSVCCALALVGMAGSVMNRAGADPVVYPYFFLDPEQVGLSCAALWILALLAAFIALGFLLFAIDRLLLRLQKK